MLVWLEQRAKWIARAPVMRVIWLIVLFIATIVDSILFVLSLIGALRNREIRTFYTIERNALLKASDDKDTKFDDVFHRTVIQNVLPSLEQSEMKYFVPAVNFAEFLQRKLNVERTLKMNCPLHNPQKVFIISLPRTGSTFLHHLCSLDPQARTVKAWEFRDPPKFNDSLEREKQRVDKVQALLSVFYKIAPAVKDIHYIEAIDADECVQGFMDCAVPDWYLWGAITAQEAFDWYVDGDMTPLYVNYAKFLQTLPITAKQTHMWLKSPHHTFKLMEIARAFPECKFVWLHRAPIENSVASCCSMNQAILDATSPWYMDEHALGARTMKRMAQCVNKAMRDREVLESEGSVFVDLQYSDFKRDPLLALKQMYSQLDMDFSKEFQNKVEQVLNAETRTQTPLHKYNLADFGLTNRDVDEAFASYRERFF